MGWYYWMGFGGGEGDWICIEIGRIKKIFGGTGK
jgi:hypothetical protein